MAVVTGLLITNAGAARIAADLSGGADLALSHVAWGDAGGAPYDPVAAQTALAREKYRATIASVAATDGAIVIDAILPADTDDAQGRDSHGFNVAECGLFASDGTLVAVARMGNGYKPGPATGQAVVATYRLKLAVANPAAIAVVVDPQAQVALGREVRPQWITVDGVLNAPPASPAAGATYVIGAAPTGAWAGFAGRLAQWIGVWSLATAPTGHIVADASKAESDPSRHLKYIGGAWVPWVATDATYGPARAATDEEAQTGAPVDAYVTPDQIGLGRVPIAALPWPEIYSATRKIAVTGASAAGNGGAITIVGGELFSLGVDIGDGGLGEQRRYVMPPSAIAALAINSTYYLRARVNAGSLQVYLQRGTDADATPVSLVGTPDAAAGGGFDTTKLDILFARIVTGAAESVPVVSTYKNAAQLSLTTTRDTPDLGTSESNWVWQANGESVHVAGNGTVTWTLNFDLGWARKPTDFAPGGSYHVGTANEVQALSGWANYISVSSATRDRIVVVGQSDYAEAMVWTGGGPPLKWTAHKGRATLQVTV